MQRKGGGGVESFVGSLEVELHAIPVGSVREDDRSGFIFAFLPRALRPWVTIRVRVAYPGIGFWKRMAVGLRLTVWQPQAHNSTARVWLFAQLFQLVEPSNSFVPG